MKALDPLPAFRPGRVHERMQTAMQSGGWNPSALSRTADFFSPTPTPISSNSCPVAQSRKRMRSSICIESFSGLDATCPHPKWAKSYRLRILESRNTEQNREKISTGWFGETYHYGWFGRRPLNASPTLVVDGRDAQFAQGNGDRSQIRGFVLHRKCCGGCAMSRSVPNSRNGKHL